MTTVATYHSVTVHISHGAMFTITELRCQVSSSSSKGMAPAAVTKVVESTCIGISMTKPKLATHACRLSSKRILWLCGVIKFSNILWQFRIQLLIASFMAVVRTATNNCHIRGFIVGHTINDVSIDWFESLSHFTSACEENIWIPHIYFPVVLLLCGINQVGHSYSPVFCSWKWWSMSWWLPYRQDSKRSSRNVLLSISIAVR